MKAYLRGILFIANIIQQAFRDNYFKKEELSSERFGLQTMSYITVNLSETGLFRCLSTNSYGDYFSYKMIINVPDFEIFADNMYQKHSSHKTVEVIHGEKLKIVCAGSIFLYKKDIRWYHNNTYIDIWEDLNSHQQNFFHSSVSHIEITASSTADGYYTCNILTKQGFLKSQTLLVQSQGTQFLYITRSNLLNQEAKVALGEKVTFYCYALGFPTPYLQWFKNNQMFNSSKKNRLLDDKQVLELTRVDFEDEGTYTCRVSNRYEVQSRSETLSIQEDTFVPLWVSVGIIFMLTVLVTIASVYYIILRKRRSRTILDLDLSSLTYFERGALENLNRQLGIENQAHLLPYNSKWEIPIEHIKLGKLLGRGAFGTVFQAEIIDFFPNEKLKTVAIKTVDKYSDVEHIKALESELKIMAHVGKHINVVNFLGACTKNIRKRELYVIMEYCKFGSLEDHILRYSENFRDQKNYETDQFDWFSDSSKFSKYSTNSDTDQIHLNQTEMKIEFYKNSDFHGNKTFISSKDLLSWAFQIARGMDYLGSRRVVHGDLAARNVLLTDHNVVKISDFGLARKIYKYGNYVKQGKATLPIKWLAIETIRKGIFSIQSDVWAFGIVLWEIFSLGGNPYPGIPGDETFLKMLIDGYRMDSPETATTSIYNIMLDCWNIDPLKRPSFHELSERIGLLLEDPVKNHYVNMNNEYLHDSEDNDEDLLAAFVSPTYDNMIVNK